MALDGLEIVSPSGAKDSIEVVVGHASRFFDGHLPGQPILPAVAQLVLVEALLRRAFGDDARIASIGRLRLVAQVHPGDRLTLRLDLGPAHAPPADREAGGSARFEIACEGLRIAEGTLCWCLREDR